MTNLPLTALVALPALAAWGVIGYRARGTTLLAVWGWSVAAILALLLASVEFANSASPVVTTSPLRYLAAVLGLSPIVALLGAKRPQHHAWQLIVGSFVALMLLPAGEGLLFGTGRVPELHVTRQVLLLGLVGVGTANYLPTRYALPACCYAAAQLALLAPFVQVLRSFDGPNSLVIAETTVAAAAILAWCVSRWRRSGAEITAPWLTFRDVYGLAWPLRVAERFNTTAAAQAWGVRLGWNGLEPPEQSAAETAFSTEMAGNFDSLLRRFVSREWIARQRVRDT